MNLIIWFSLVMLGAICLMALRDLKRSWDKTHQKLALANPDRPMPSTGYRILMSIAVLVVLGMAGTTAWAFKFHPPSNHINRVISQTGGG